MEAANRGAQEAGGVSVGCDIELPARAAAELLCGHRAALQTLLRAQGDVRALRVRIRDRPRRVWHARRAVEALTLIQTETIKHFPLVLLGEKEWSGLLEWLTERALAAGRINAADLALIRVMNDPAEVCELVGAAYQQACAQLGQMPRRRAPA